MNHAHRLQHPVHIVGAGLAGSLMALLLANRGIPVHLVERRPDPRRKDLPAGRSINLALSTRGLTALARAGLEREVLAMSVPMRGRRMHAPDGARTFQPYGRPDEAILSISRPGLNRLLLEAADRHEHVQITFDARCVDLDPTTPSLTLETGGDLHTLPSHWILGADGAFSAVRRRLQLHDRFQFQQHWIEHAYKELEIPPTPDGDWALENDGLHIWPRHDFMLIALPNPDRTFTATLFLALEGEGDSFDALRSDDDVARFFEREFPDALALLPNLLDDWHANPTSGLVWIKCFPYHRGRSLLVGDAAHAIVPFYAQGMNSAFEDCRVIDELVDELGIGDPLALGARFSELRKPHADAICDLAMENFVEMRSRVASPAFLERKQLESVLMTAFPETYRSLYGMVTFSNIPYADARALDREQTHTLDTRPEAALALLTLAWVRTLLA